MPHAGDVTHVGVTVSPLGPDGVGGVICLFSDLTAVVQLEDQLRLKETLARLGELTAGIAHEFRNGLATIHGYGKLLDPAALPPQFQPVRRGHPAGDRRARAGRDELPELCPSYAVVAGDPRSPRRSSNAPSTMCRSEARQFDGDIAVAGEFGQVDADDVLLRQAFSNLLRNAVEACQGGSVTPSIRVEGALDPAQRVARVNVLDNGPGVPADARERIFRPFFTTKKNGTGLGLALVQKIIVTHNGRVRGHELARRRRLFPGDVADRLNTSVNMALENLRSFCSTLRLRTDLSLASLSNSGNFLRTAEVTCRADSARALAMACDHWQTIDCDVRSGTGGSRGCRSQNVLAERVQNVNACLGEDRLSSRRSSPPLSSRPAFSRWRNWWRSPCRATSGRDSSTLAGILAAQKIEELRSLAWEFDVNGGSR